MGLLRKTLNGTTCQTKAIFVPKEYRGGGSKWADWKKEYDGKSNVTIYEMVLRSRSNTNIKRNRLSASTVRCTKRTRRSEPTASTVRLEKSASTIISIPIHGLVSKGEVSVILIRQAFPHLFFFYLFYFVLVCFYLIRTRGYHSTGQTDPMMNPEKSMFG